MGGELVGGWGVRVRWMRTCVSFLKVWGMCVRGEPMFVSKDLWEWFMGSGLYVAAACQGSCVVGNLS